MDRNFDREFQNLLASFEGTPRLLLHACCAPCSSSVLERLAGHFELTVFFYNPNIEPREEYEKRLSELERFLKETSNAKLLVGDYDPKPFLRLSEGLEELPEGRERCRRCIAMRLSETARKAGELHMDYFATTLTVSPLKNAKMVNLEGEEAGRRFGIKYLLSDFKKRDGYKRSIELSREYGIYRQNYCGCVFSERERKISFENHS